MRVAEADVAAIILTLLDEMSLCAGGHVMPETLQRAWPGVGLRESDLEVALDKLLADDSLVVEQIDEHQSCYTLSEIGHKRMLQLNSPMTFGLAGYQRLRRNAERRVRERAGASGPSLMEERRLITTHH